MFHFQTQICILDLRSCKSITHFLDFSLDWINSMIGTQMVNLIWIWVSARQIIQIMRVCYHRLSLVKFTLINGWFNSVNIDVETQQPSDAVGQVRPPGHFLSQDSMSQQDVRQFQVALANVHLQVCGVYLNQSLLIAELCLQIFMQCSGGITYPNVAVF